MTSQTSSSLQVQASKPALATTSPPNAAAGGSWRMVLAMALSGTIGLLVVESGLPVLWVVWLRCLLGGLGLAAWVWWSGQWSRPTWRESAWLLLGAAALIVNWLCLFRAYEYSGIAIATVVYHVQPFLLLLLAALLQGEPLPLNRLPWLLLALVGVGLSSGLVGLTDQQASHGQSLGIVLALLAASLYALATLATQRLRRLAPAQIAMLQMLLGVLSLLPWVWELRAQALFSPKVWAAVLVLGLVHTAWMYTLMYTAFQRLQAQAIAGLSFIYPVMALLVDLLWFGAKPLPAQWLGMVLILGALAAYRRSERKPSQK
ncbi:DMT family transporter [Comamonas thiooxydans]|uniref:DMT family transporter n=1 Tax=Comamonas thiooxydans TaxID=363952 RepID=UPI000B359426|nr:DMT family transporter [Comamonas thiooxydans]BDR10729.1 DMT family transporter [Comamonas thiooxydans]